MSKLETKAHKFFLEGLKSQEAFIRGVKQMRRDMVDAAFYFLQARECVEHGNWGQFLDLYSDRVSPRTVRRWCEYAEASVEWVRKTNPNLKSLPEIQAAAREHMIMSPKQWVALCRTSDVGIMRPFGEYDAVRYAKQKAIGNGSEQIEFNFSQVVATLDVLTHFGDENYRFTYPEDKDEAEYISEVEAKLVAALNRVRSIKQHGRVIEA